MIKLFLSTCWYIIFRKLIPIGGLVYIFTYMFMHSTPYVGIGVIWFINLEVSLDVFIAFYLTLFTESCILFYYLILLVLKELDIVEWSKEIKSVS